MTMSTLPKDATSEKVLGRGARECKHHRHGLRGRGSRCLVFALSLAALAEDLHVLDMRPADLVQLAEIP